MNQISVKGYFKINLRENETLFFYTTFILALILTIIAFIIIMNPANSPKSASSKSGNTSKSSQKSGKKNTAKLPSQMASPVNSPKVSKQETLLTTIMRKMKTYEDMTADENSFWITLPQSEKDRVYASLEKGSDITTSGLLEAYRSVQESNWEDGEGGQEAVTLKYQQSESNVPNLGTLIGIPKSAHSSITTMGTPSKQPDSSDTTLSTVTDNIHSDFDEPSTEPVEEEDRDHPFADIGDGMVRDLTENMIAFEFCNEDLLQSNIPGIDLGFTIANQLLQQHGMSVKVTRTQNLLILAELHNTKTGMLYVKKQNTDGPKKDESQQKRQVKMKRRTSLDPPSTDSETTNGRKSQTVRKTTKKVPVKPSINEGEKPMVSKKPTREIMSTQKGGPKDSKQPLRTINVIVPSKYQKQSNYSFKYPIVNEEKWQGYTEDQKNELISKYIVANNISFRLQFTHKVDYFYFKDW